MLNATVENASTIWDTKSNNLSNECSVHTER